MLGSICIVFIERIYMKTKIINISIPNQLLNEADEIAENEYRNRSELFREALRMYILERKNLASIYEYGKKQAKKAKISSINLNQAISSYRKNK